MEAQANPRSVRWCDWEGNPVCWAGPLKSIEMVSQGFVSSSPALLRFPAPDSFVAGNLRSCSPFWEVVLKGHPKASEILGYITEGLGCRSFLFRSVAPSRAVHTILTPPPPESVSLTRLHVPIFMTLLRELSSRECPMVLFWFAARLTWWTQLIL